MFMLIIAPMFQLIVLGSAVNFDVDRVPTVVVDRDRSAESRGHLQALLADGTLLSAGQVDSEDEAMDWLEDGRAAAALVIPPNFGRDLGRGKKVELQVLLDGSDPNRSGVVGGAVARYSGELGLAMARERLQRRAAGLGRVVPLGGQTLLPRVYYNPRLRTPVWMVPGLTAMLLVIVTTIVTSMGLAREKEMGTMEQVLVTPIRPLVLLVGKLAPFLVIGLLDLTLALVVAAWIFDVPIRGSLPFLYGATSLYLLSTLGTGLFISTISSNQQQAFMSGFLFMLPAVFLSGNMTPIASMPSWMQPFTWLNPVRYEVEILRAVLLKGAGPADLWRQLLALAIFGVTILGSASLRFRKRLA